MAEKDDDSMIGYDPLAWLQESGQAGGEVAPLPVEFVTEDEPEDLAPPAVAASVAEPEWVTLAETETVEEEDASMAEAAQGAADVQSVLLAAVQNIQNVAQLHERLMSALDKGSQLEIDASAITTIDTATLQLLLVLKQTALKMHKQVVIDFPSDKFVEAASLLGLAEMLDVDQAAAGFF
jgi:STAS domain.